MYYLSNKIFFSIFILFNYPTVMTKALDDIPCSPRKYQYDSIVCVCNASYCDEISKIVQQPPGKYLLYSSTMSGLRFERTEGKINEYREDPPRGFNDLYRKLLISFNLSPNTEEVILYLNREKLYQKMIGFGGAFSDSASINFKKLSDKTQEKLIQSYFSEKGIEYNMGRVPIGGSDFSLKPYAYNMYPENDITLSNFSLSEEDYDLKIPFIQLALKSSNYKLKLMAAAWSPPSWMKTNNDICGIGYLKENYYQTWADYHLKFLEAYEKENITFWSISTGNEPVNGVIAVKGFNALGWLPHSQAKWIAENFGPTIKNKYKNMTIITLDDQRFTIPTWVSIVSLNKKALDYIDGFGLHWYLNRYFPIQLADFTHTIFKTKFLISTEACTGIHEEPYDFVRLGAWYRAEILARDMIENFNHWFVGWVDWNLVLDIEGGPNWFKNYVDASIISLPENDEFVKQPTFYAMGHFSKFVLEGSVRIDLQKTSGDGIDKVAFLRPDGGVVVIILNTQSISHLVTIREKDHGLIELIIPPRSMHTILYW